MSSTDRKLTLTQTDATSKAIALLRVTSGGWAYPLFWTIALVAQAMPGGGAYAIGSPLKTED